ncbi:MAG: polyprenyl diphosphate synthase [Methanobrevibacter boviskoreani]|jgi:tritrans,polycis-undecaprenyl-diphosphate synthase [geranylgeranyl-diphosphate specific]|uniref:polyprenyl diphosphate synthase n=1 Tax=Methanobrevibacter TaxID=2172 RepID=UPI0003348445|nr:MULTISPECIES: polyprenyl diphosphate synthase [Methanobrevibacter]AGN16569.1 undecaprenyl pyrophosphate synthetase UppS [Methanobrevibacter sp. AbM4]MCI6775255.1 polyprenyl diphosphate synthase [Methanobrevibacter boviskoreani]MCI6931307.1 polyprenyl diphosphate synthase [Methanobrevibacter boviskoreani]MDD6257542.1 polyprenyl diphosphate synthase [Methanobrevibacter boviskoreani]MDY5614659.1 polyprenyl diphosphate synthase [Methanobrevibacter boviskoreani]
MVAQFFYRIYEWYIMKHLDPNKMPKHIAIIMDGNRRYSKIQGNMDVIKGHEKGVDTLEKVLDWTIDLGIKIITVYAFSTENFNRSKHEVDGLMDLFVKNFKRLTTNEKIHRNHVKVQVVGRTDLLPDDVKDAIKEAEESTKDYKDRLFNLAIGYDGRLEIVDAVKKVYKEIEEGKLSIDDVNEEIIGKNLYTGGLEDPNLIIRTSGEERLSGFLLWQSSYSELYFCDSLWPEFRKTDFLRAIRDYQARDRRFGT